MDADENLLRAVVLSPELVDVICDAIDQRGGGAYPKTDRFITAYYQAGGKSAPAGYWLTRRRFDDDKRLGRQVLNILRQAGHVLRDRRRG